MSITDSSRAPTLAQGSSTTPLAAFMRRLNIWDEFVPLLEFPPELRRVV